jgi:acetyl esterase/lipase
MLNKVTKILYLCIVFLLISCSNDDPATDNLFVDATQFLNESYGNDSQQQYDIYLPEGRTMQTPVVILVHGGSWSGGDKSDMNLLVTLLRNNWSDYAIVNTNYRLTTQNTNQHPAQLDDLSALIIQLNSNRSLYQVSDTYFFIGISAGGHLSLLYTYRNDIDHKVKAVCSIVGPTDFSDPVYTDSANEVLQANAIQFLGDTYVNNPDLYVSASPITHIDALDAPTIMFYGGKDNLVPVSQPIRLKDKLTAFNIPVSYTLYPDSGHDLFGVDFIDISNKIKIFFNTYQ